MGITVRRAFGTLLLSASVVTAGAVPAQSAQAHDDAGNSSYLGPRKFRTRDLTNVMAVAITGDYEAYLSIGVGMRRQTWANVFTLTAPTRVVIDVGR